MRYFINVAYLGTNYAGSQIQQNGLSVQSVIEEKLGLILGNLVHLTGGSRTDKGVHTIENYYHFDTQKVIDQLAVKHSLNALLPNDIHTNSIKLVVDNAHARFDALERSYEYIVLLQKDVFYHKRAYFIKSNKLHINHLYESAEYIKSQTDFISFSKKHTQVNNFNCNIKNCYWEVNGHTLHFHITANRFLRGMVRALVATQLLVSNDRISMEAFRKLFTSPRIASANFSAPAHGLYLKHILYPSSIYIN